MLLEGVADSEESVEFGEESDEPESSRRIVQALARVRAQQAWMQLAPRAQQAQMQLGPSACVSCLAALHANVLRLLLLQVARNPTSTSAGRSASFHQATASAACERSWRLTPACIRGPVATPPGMQRGVQSCHLPAC